jgi:hypothetical protein
MDREAIAAHTKRHDHVRVARRRQHCVIDALQCLHRRQIAFRHAALRQRQHMGLRDPRTPAAETAAETALQRPIHPPYHLHSQVMIDVQYGHE